MSTRDPKPTPSNQPQSGALVRRRAIDALLAVEGYETGSQEAIRNALRRKPLLASVDHGLLTEMVYGCLRRQRSLDGWIAKVAKRGLHGMDVRSLVTLRLAAYQLAAMDRVPDYAAIDATTNAARKVIGRGQVGFVHGAMRSLARTTPWNDDAGDDLPAWIRRHIDELAEDAGVPGAELQAAFEAPAPLHIHAIDDDAARDLRAEGVELERIGDLQRVFAANGPAFFASETFQRRRAIAQDAGSAAVVKLVAPQPGERIADVCAGRGAKTLFLVGAGAEVTAFDTRKDALAAAKRLCESAGVSMPETRVLDLTKGDPEFDAQFDAVLVDAPCTGLGTVRRRPEIRHRRRAADIAINAQLQRRILANAAEMVKPGGRLIYAVCSMTRAEGSRVVDHFLAARDDFSRVGEDLRTHPLDFGMDAFYAACLTRK